MISETLRHEIDVYADQLRRESRLLLSAKQGRVGAESVGYYLASIHYLVQHTPVHLTLALRRARDAGHDELAAYFARKLEEEVGHDAWSAADLEAVATLARRPIHREPSRAMVALVAWIEESITRDPFRYLAYILFVEYLTVKLGPEWVATLEQRCGVPASAMSSQTNHIELDKEHVAEGCTEIDVLVDERHRAPLVEMLRGSMARFSAFCDDVCDHAA